MPRTARKPKIEPKPHTGDLVLCGSTKASLPSDWFFGQVIWVGSDDVLIQRATHNGQTWREVIHTTAIRAFGTTEELVSIQSAARAAVKDLAQQIREAEVALGQARAALWGKVSELAEGGLRVIPPDFAAIERSQSAMRAIIEQADADNDGREASEVLAA